MIFLNEYSFCLADHLQCSRIHLSDEQRCPMTTDPDLQPRSARVPRRDVLKTTALAASAAASALMLFCLFNNSDRLRLAVRVLPSASIRSARK